METPYSTSKIKYNTELVTWSNIPVGNTAQYYSLKDIPTEISCHVTGTFGGTTITIKGGNNVNNIDSLLQQENGNTATITSADIFTISDKPLFIQPIITGGSNASISIYMAIKYIFN